MLRDDVNKIGDIFYGHWRLLTTHSLQIKSRQRYNTRILVTCANKSLSGVIWQIWRWETTNTILRTSIEEWHTVTEVPKQPALRRAGQSERVPPQTVKLRCILHRSWQETLMFLQIPWRHISLSPNDFITREHAGGTSSNFNLSTCTDFCQCHNEICINLTCQQEDTMPSPLQRRRWVWVSTKERSIPFWPYYVAGGAKLKRATTNWNL